MVSEQQKLCQQQPAKAQTCPDAPLDGPQSRLAPIKLTTDSSCPRDVLDFLSIGSAPARSKASSTTQAHRFSPAIYGRVFFCPTFHVGFFICNLLRGWLDLPPTWQLFCHFKNFFQKIVNIYLLALA